MSAARLPWWRRALAFIAFTWGQSLVYWGNLTMSKTLYDWAVGSYGYALAANPRLARALERRGVIKGRELSDYAGGVRDLTAAIELEPEWPVPYLQRGLLHRFQSAAAAPRAIADFERYLELGPDPYWAVEVERLIAQLRDESDEREAYLNRKIV